MKTKAIIISLFFCLFMGASFLCGATPYLSGGQPADSVLWKQQLDMIKKNTAEYHLGYVLTGYKYGKTKLMSLKEFSSIDKEKAENMRKDVRKTLDQLLRLRLGLEEVELEWTCDGTIYKTVCVVSGTLGILYENVFINSFQPGVETTTVRSEF